MENFKPVLAPPEKPEPWWKRLASYVLLCLVIPALFAGAVIAFAILSASYWRTDHVDVLLEKGVPAALIVGFLFALGYCIHEEADYRRHIRTRGDR